ncbi:MAG TPA: endonuclease Q family protein [Patescibacteria group bacterium]|nr:endonuclease Q family protein [Patescibacteria group bacterium]
MLEKILDLHIHSRYSRACSKDLELPKIAKACETKGIDIVATGDFTHPAWFRHIEESLVEVAEGLYKLKDLDSPTRFILGTEVSCIYKHKEATRRLHLVLLAPNLKAVAKLNQALEDRGVNIRSDGRPIMGLPAKELLKIMLEIDPRFMMIPAHAWTPWFAVFGSKSGYDRLEDCFEELTPHIRAIETGLSSDPVMNRRLSALDNIVLVSNSDAHSLDKLGREANVFGFKDEKEVNYTKITEIIKSGDKKSFLYTIEFYPEEGKYHYDGHRDCKISLNPKETKKLKNICPVCHKELTIGVLHRVDDLADREEKDIDSNKFIPHRYIIPLSEILSSVLGVGTKSKKVVSEYNHLIKHFGSEFNILLHVETEEIEKVSNYLEIGEAIKNMREGKTKIIPGYDGEFGQIEVEIEKERGKQKSLL